MPKEAKARILINELLQRSGWRFFDNEQGPANVTLETNVKLKKRVLDELGDDLLISDEAHCSLGGNSRAAGVTGLRRDRHGAEYM